MTDNPFDALASGGLDMNALLEQAQAMQQQFVAAQAELAETKIEGRVAGGSVVVTLTGTGELNAIAIREGVIEHADAEGLADLADLILAAYRDAKARADDTAAAKLGPMAGM